MEGNDRDSAVIGVNSVEDHALELRRGTIQIGVWLTVIVALGSALYVSLTWDEAHRHVIISVVVAALISAVAIGIMPRERVIHSRLREPFFVLWSVLDIGLITVLVAADGGVTSPFAFLFFLPLLFGTLSYPLRLTFAVGTICAGAFLGVAAAAGDDLMFSLFGAFALICAAVMATWESRDHATLTQRLAIAAGALRTSAEINKSRAHQQEEVARFGHIALAGTDVDLLFERATKLVAEVLDVEISALLHLLPEEKVFEMTASVGIPDAMGDAMPVPAGMRSHAGYTMMLGAPVIVSDWAAEGRFEMSPVLRARGAKCGITVPVHAGSVPYGVLGAQSLTKRPFDSQDVSFLQSIANVLGYVLERLEKERRIRHDALHDPLTGLANRNLFLDRLDQALARALRSESKVAVLFLDLDQFKRINDSLGHGAGDELLASVAPRLSSAVRPGDTVARFGGDEFMILAENVKTDDDATAFVTRISAALSRPFDVYGTEHFVSTSIGIAIGDGTEAPEVLIRDADAALYAAKERGRGRHEIFDGGTRARMVEHLETENDLRRAIEREQLLLHYQPIIRISDQEIVGFEALVRWQHPVRGILGPLAFIPLAEDSNLIHSIGTWVLREACHRAAAWQADHPDNAPIKVAVNLSPRQLTDPSLIATIEMALTASGIQPATLQLELTEGVLLDDTEAAEAALAMISKLGVRIVLDDFGSGFSSLGYLKRLPLNGIKLDRVFIDSLELNSTDAAIVSAVVELARTFDLTVVAEGVETEEQLAIVNELGCGYVQGYHFSRPVPSAAVTELIDAPPWNSVTA